jgi:hypothetical protein
MALNNVFWLLLCWCVFMLNIANKPSVIMLSVIMQNVIMLRKIMLNVIVACKVEPKS